MTPHPIHLSVPDFIVIGLYIAILLGIGGWVSFRHRGSEDFFLGGRSMKWRSIGLSIFGTNIGPTFLIASCGAGYTTGLVNANYEWMAWIFLALLGMVFVPYYLHYRVSTMPEFLLRRFGTGTYRFMVGYALFGTIVLWIGGTLYAGGSLLAQLLDWNLLFSISVLAFLATVFTVTGGLRAVMVTDSFQSILIILGAGSLTISALWHVDGWDALRTISVGGQDPSMTWELFQPAGSATPWYAFILGYPVLSLWFWCSDQTIVQRVLGGESLEESQKGTLFCGFLKILPPFIFILPGILAAVLLPGIEDDKLVFLNMVDTFLGSGFKGLIVAVIFAAVVSTLNSGLNSFSTVVTLDILGRISKEPMSSRATRYWGMFVTLLAAVLAIAIALYLNAAQQRGGLNLFDLFQSLIGYMAPPVATVFVLGIFWRKATSAAALATLVFGSILCLGLGASAMLQPDWFRSADGTELLPHFLLQSFFLFAFLMGFMVLFSLLSASPRETASVPSLKQVYKNEPNDSLRRILKGWAILALIMVALYVFFQTV
jgi:SSS family solute:Na+ symporter